MREHKIFILDDEPDIGRYVAQVAELSGFDSRSFSEPEPFLAALEETPEACIAIDLQMPVMDGIEVLRHLSVLRFRRPIIIMSGMDRKVLEAARHFAKVNALPVADIVSKPVRVEELRRVFQKLQESKDLLPTRTELTEAIRKKEFQLYLQPKVKIVQQRGRSATYVPIGFEGLMRWASPARGLVPPDVFIPLIAAGQLNAEFADMLFDCAMVTLEDWRAAGIDASLAINMSAGDVEDLGLADRLWKRCAGLGIDHEKVIIEITESVAMRHPEQALDVLTRLRLRGFLLSLDDFGTGYSSLVQLQRLPFAELKIDRSLVSDCVASDQTRIIVKAIIDLGHNLGLTVTAEGVEDLATLDLLNDLSCDLAQGFFFARPLPPDEAQGWWFKHMPAESRAAHS